MIKKNPSRQNEPSLRKLTVQQLVDLYHQLNQQFIQSAHQQAKPYLLKPDSRGSVKADSQILDRIRRVREEVDRRVERGEPDTQAAFEKSLSEGFAELQPQNFWKPTLAPFPEKAGGQQPEKESRWYESHVDVLRRRQIVLTNPNLPAEKLCEVFDTNSIPLPSAWEDRFNVSTWVEAYKIKKARASIQRIISTDRKKQ